MHYKSGCVICGGELVYSEASASIACHYCGTVNDTSVSCTNGHYVCDACHRGSANDFIERHCINTAEVDPIRIAIKIMSGSAVKMHGPEHHFLVPAVLLAAYYNQGFASSEDKADKIMQARKRAEIVPGGFCAFYGTCGAAVGTGIFISLLTKATPLSKREWKLSNLMTAESLKAIAEHGGPRCCKRDSFLAILAAVEFVNKQLGAAWHVDQPVICAFHTMNAECLKKECPFYASESL